jgi:hypothetical protein
MLSIYTCAILGLLIYACDRVLCIQTIIQSNPNIPQRSPRALLFFPLPAAPAFDLAIAALFLRLATGVFLCIDAA